MYAVQAPLTALHWVPAPAAQGRARLLALGDAQGGLHLLSRGGEVLAQFYSGSAAAVTALGSYPLRHNATVLLSGHASGEVRLHLLPLPLPGPPTAKAGSLPSSDWSEDALGGGGPMPLAAFAAQQLLCQAPAGRSPAAGGGGTTGSAACAASAGGDASCPPIAHLHAAGKASGQAVVAVADAAGGVAALRHAGPRKHPEVVLRGSSGQPVTAIRASQSALTLVGTTGAARVALPRRPPKAAVGAATGLPALHFAGCRGLEQQDGGASLVAAAFDATSATRAYALTDRGRVATLALGSKAQARRDAACTLRFASPGLLPQQAAAPAAPMRAARQQLAEEQQEQQPLHAEKGPLLQPPQPLRAVLASLRGHLLVSAGGRLAVLNVSQPARAPPQLVLLQPLANLSRELEWEEVQTARAGALEQPRWLPEPDAAAGADEAGAARPPPLAASGDGLVAVGVGAGLVAVFETGLPSGRGAGEGPGRKRGGVASWLGVLQPVAMLVVVGVVVTRSRQRRQARSSGQADSLRQLERLLESPLLDRDPKWRRGKPVPPDADGSESSGAEGAAPAPRPRVAAEAGEEGSEDAEDAELEEVHTARRHLNGGFARGSAPGGPGGSSSGDEESEGGSSNGSAVAFGSTFDLRQHGGPGSNVAMEEEAERAGAPGEGKRTGASVSQEQGATASTRALFPLLPCARTSLHCLAGDVHPRSIFPCVVGRLLNRSEGDPGDAASSVYVGEECAAALGRRAGGGGSGGAAAPGHAGQQLATSYPMENGIIKDWGDMRLVWEHTFRDVLRLDPTHCQIMLTDPPMNPSENRRRMLEVMFEEFGFQRAFIQRPRTETLRKKQTKKTLDRPQVQAVLTLYSQGLLTGLVLDSGDGVTHAVPVVEGYSSPHLIRRVDVAGRHLTAHLADLLARRRAACSAARTAAGYSITSPADFAAVQRAKEKLCYVALDYAQEARLARETTACVQQYTLPDGRVITLGAERYQAPEALFRPSLLGVEAPGVAELVHSCIADSAIDNRMALYSHVVLSGGTTLLPGFGARLAQELRGIYLDRVLKGNAEGLTRLKLRVDDPPRRRVAVFMGASVLASIMADQPEYWVGREEWAEDPRRALAKCAGALAR
eukprot:scaffold10.g2382.t1